jgi:hypothetical protein
VIRRESIREETVSVLIGFYWNVSRNGGREVDDALFGVLAKTWL